MPFIAYMKRLIETDEVQLKPAKMLAWALDMAGVPQKEIGKIIDRNARSVRYYIAEVQNMLANQPGWSESLLKYNRLIPKSIKVIEKYLDGKGAKVGGDLEVACRILEGAGILPRKDAGLINETNISLENQDIVVQNLPDHEFAAEVPKELERMFNVMRRLEST